MSRYARKRMVPLSLFIAQLLACLISSFPMVAAAGDNSGAIDSVSTPLMAEVPFDSSGVLLQGFSSHLPLVVIDTGATAPDTFEHTGATGNVTVSVHDQESNSPFSQPDLRVNATLQSISFLLSARREKPDYALWLQSEQALCGMDEQRGWLLLGAQADKSLLRNYLAYTLAAQAGMPAPQVRLCEVILVWQGVMYYAGVYTLAQNTGQWAMNDASGPVTLQRLPYVGEKNQLPTQAAETQYPPGSIVALGDGLSTETQQEITARIDQIDAALYSTDHLRYLTYAQYLDEDSFVDSFVLNEFMCNYEAAYQALYTYISADVALEAGPLGSFETAVDNSSYQPIDPWQIWLHKTPWYERLAYSEQFWQKVHRRYKSLRKDVLSDRNIDALIDAASQRLGIAAQRDWIRWSDAYQSPPLALAEYTGRAPLDDEEIALIPLYDPDRDVWSRIRQTDSYQQELIRLKYLLHAHGGYLYEAYPAMARQEALIRPEDDYITNSLQVVGFIVLFFGSVVFARRRNR